MSDKPKVKAKFAATGNSNWQKLLQAQGKPLVSAKSKPSKSKNPSDRVPSSNGHGKAKHSKQQLKRKQPSGQESNHQPPHKAFRANDGKAVRVDGSGAAGTSSANKASSMFTEAMRSKPRDGEAPVKTTHVALDCEMVGVGAGGTRSALAQVVVVNSSGHVLYSTYVKTQEKVTDFRTKVSGVRPQDLQHGVSFQEAQRKVAKLLNGSILIGHGLENDLKALMMSHPKRLIRDTAKFSGFRGRGPGKGTPGLRHLTQEFLGATIQTGEHNPKEDAVAALCLYKLKQKEWEKNLTAMHSKQKQKKK